MNSDNQYLSFRLSTWMCGQGLHLKGLELVLFALIWSFALRGKLMFLPEKSLAEVFGCTREQVGRSLALLHKKHLVIRSGKRRKHEKQLSPTYDYTIDLDGIGKIYPGIRVIWDKEKKDLNTSRQKVSFRSDIMSHNKENDEYECDNGGGGGGEHLREQTHLPIPTLEEIKAYANETNSHIDPEDFFKSCSDRNWVIGGHLVEDWKMLFDKWTDKGKARDKNFPYYEKVAFTHKQRKSNIDEYEQLLNEIKEK